MHFLINSKFWLLWALLLATWWSNCLFDTMYWCLLCIYPVVGLLGHMANLFLVFQESSTSTLFSSVAVLSYVPTEKIFLCLHILTSICYSLMDFSHSDRGRAISHCAFNVHAPDGYWYWAFKKVIFGHLHFFFWNLLRPFVYLLTRLIVIFLGGGFLKVLIRSRY